MVAAKVWNCFADAKERRQLEVIEHGDSLQILMQKALNEEKMLSIRLKGVSRNDEIVIPLESVHIANLFDPDVYQDNIAKPLRRTRRKPML